MFRVSKSLKFVLPAYITFLVFVLTQGPVYKIAFSDGQASIKPDALTVAFSIFVLAQLPALSTFGQGNSVAGFELNRDSRAVVAIILIMVMSTAWSTARGATLTASAAFALTALTAISLVPHTSTRHLMWGVLIGVQPGLFLSLYAVKHRWSGALEAKSSLEPWITTNNWVGIYGNRNSLAPVAAIGALTCVFTAWDLLRRRTGLAVSGFILIAVVGCLDGLILIRSGSATLPFSILIATMLICFSTLCQRIWQFKSYGRSTSYLSIGILGMGVLLSGFVLNLATGKYERLSGFDGRTAFWRVAFDAWRSRPITGWGFMALWNTESFRKNLPSSLVNAMWGHSSYLDLLAGGGILLAVPVAIVIGALLYRILFKCSRGLGEAWMAIISMTILVASTQESFLLGSHFFLLILIVTGMKLKSAPRIMDSML